MQIFNPYVLKFKGHIPALKNDKTAIVDAKGKPRLIHSPEVLRWLRTQEGGLIQQVKKNSWEVIPKPTRVGVFAYIYIYGPNAPHSYPRRDGDNMYTTLQETLQSPDKPSGIAGLIEDDSQISLGAYEIVYVKSEVLEGATLYLWPRFSTVFKELQALAKFIKEQEENSDKALYQLPDDLFE